MQSFQIKHPVKPFGADHSRRLALLVSAGIHVALLTRMLAERAAGPIWRGFFRGATACILLLLAQGLSDDQFTPTFPQTFLWLSYGMALGLVTRPDAAVAISAKRSA